MWRLLLQQSDNPGQLEPSDDPGRFSAQPSAQPSARPSGTAEQPPSLPFPTKSTTDVGAPPQADDRNLIEQFWSLYPAHRRGTKKAIRIAWDEAPPPADIISRLRAWLSTITNPKYVPKAEKWIRERRWSEITVQGPSAEYLAWLKTPEGREHQRRKEADS